MITTVSFAVLAVGSAGLAIVFSDTRKVVIASWVAAMSVGALFLAYGAEFLAFVQWITGTLVAISFLVYATMFGEFGQVDERSIKARIFDAIPAVLLGAAFFAMIALAAGSLSPAELGSAAAAVKSGDLASVGRSIGEHHMVSLELTAFTLLGVLIGAGVISRAEDENSSSGGSNAE